MNKPFDHSQTSAADADRRVYVNNLFDIPAVANYLSPLRRQAARQAQSCHPRVCWKIF